MSVRIHWKPCSDKGQPFSRGTSSSLDALSRAFGETIREKDVPALRAMSALGDPFFEEVADVVELVGDIKVHGVW